HFPPLQPDAVAKFERLAPFRQRLLLRPRAESPIGALAELRGPRILRMVDGENREPDVAEVGLRTRLRSSNLEHEGHRVPRMILVLVALDPRRALPVGAKKIRLVLSLGDSGDGTHVEAGVLRVAGERDRPTEALQPRTP